MRLLESDKLSARCANPRSVLTHHKRGKERCPGCENSAKHHEHFAGWNSILSTSDRKDSLSQVLGSNAAKETISCGASNSSGSSAAAEAERELAWTQLRTQRTTVWDTLIHAAGQNQAPDKETLIKLTRMPTTRSSVPDAKRGIKPLCF